MKKFTYLSRAGRLARPFLICFTALSLTVLIAITIYAANQDEFLDSAGNKPESRLFLLAGDNTDATYNNIYAMFSNLEFNGTVYGNVFTLFSEIKLGANAVIKGTIHTFSSKILFAESTNFNHSPSFVTSPFYYSGTTSGGLNFLSDIIPQFIIQLFFIICGGAMCLVVFSTSRGFVEQGAILLTAEPLRVIRNGLVSYFLMIALILIFALTIFFIPIALLFVIITIIILIFGQTSLSMLIGLTLAHRMNKRLAPLPCLCIGLLLISIIMNVPFLSFGINLLFMPILALGITLTGLINAILKKKFYYAPFKTSGKKAFDQAKIKKIILDSKEEDR